jgi:outer membrane protein OmpA-like peptidoglycan-associated protein
MSTLQTKLAKVTCGFSLGAVLLGGCATKAGTGALLGGGGGAALGAGIGALAGGGKGALIGGAAGAAVGAGAGALIGNYMDKQQAELNDKVKGANVERKGDQLVVRFSSAILFDSGKATLKPQSEKDLAEFAKVLNQYKDTDLVIEGHTDATGKKATNEKLSAARAESVVSYLEGHGVERRRLKAVGLADGRPVAENTSEDGRQKNRRVEVNIAANEALKQQDAQAAQAQPASSKQ